MRSREADSDDSGRTDCRCGEKGEAETVAAGLLGATIRSEHDAVGAPRPVMATRSMLGSNGMG
jgi:hypothetical protein